MALDEPAGSIDRWVGRSIRLGLLLLTAVIAALTVARMAQSWPREAHLGYAEGIWIGLATDTAEGTFYRPLEGPKGYGGTRYFPLFFVTHAALIRSGLSAIHAGHALAATSVVLLCAGVVLFLRRAGTSWLVAGAAAAVVLACQPTQMAALTIRGDALPAALTLLGLAFVLPIARPGTASVFFTLAFAAKPTSVYGPLAAVMTLTLTDRRSDAWRVAWQTAIGAVGVLLVVSIGSAGRFLSILGASAAGATGVSTFLAAPLSLARILRRVPESTFFMQIAAVVVLTGARHRLTIERTAFLVCGATTLAIYASPATVENHLIDLTALAVIVVAAWAAREARPAAIALALLFVGGLSAGGVAFWRAQSEDRTDLRSTRLAAVRAIADAPGPLLFEQPMLAAEQGRTPYVLDPYLFSLRIARQHAVLDRLLDDVAHRRFGAIVFEHAVPELAAAEPFAEDGTGRFKVALDEHYRLDAIVEGRAIYRPRQ